MLGLKRKIVKLVDYNPKWVKTFKDEKNKIKKVFGDSVLDIEHMGSTSIPGIKAKPIMDLMVAIPDINKYKDYIKGFNKIGYKFRKDYRETHQEHILFVKGPEDKRTHYLKLCEFNSEFWNENILFRDYLINHPDVAKEYEKLKIELNKKYSKDRDTYTDKKSTFIKDILTLANDKEK